MSDQAQIETAVEATIDNCAVLRERLLKYESADGVAHGVGVPDGYALTPKVATPEMKSAIWDELDRQGFDSDLVETQSLYFAGIAAAPKPADHSEDVRALVGGWIKCAERMPECGAPVQAYYLNSHGKGRTIRAHHIKAWTVEVEPDDPDVECVEYSEQQEAYYLLEGWYELMDNWEQYSSIAVTEGVITQWAPLLPMPKESGE